MQVTEAAVINWLLMALVGLGTTSVGILLYFGKVIITNVTSWGTKISDKVEELDDRVLVLETEHKTRSCNRS